jgi:hypothetical protein
MENITELLTTDNIIFVSGWIVFLATLVERFFAARKAGKTAAEAITVLLNTMKVEDKMLPDGRFKPELIEKADQVSKTLEVSTAAQAQVKEILTSGKTQDIKLGSIKGKPIYLGHVAGILGIGGSLAAKVREIWRKIK